MAKNFTINACILIQNVLIIQVDHQLFAMAKLDVLGDSREEVIVCAWDGQTYILDHDRNVVRYHFHKNVQVYISFSYKLFFFMVLDMTLNFIRGV